jgi:hypothetical protein
MEKECKILRSTDTRPAYDPPQAMRLSHVHTGEGLCDPAGSGDLEACYVPGSTAQNECLSEGIGAIGWCLYPGQSATASCEAPGLDGAPP